MEEYPLYGLRLVHFSLNLEDKKSHYAAFGLSILARLDKVQEELLHYPWRRRRWWHRRSQNVKVLR